MPTQSEIITFYKNEEGNWIAEFPLGEDNHIYTFELKLLGENEDGVSWELVFERIQKIIRYEVKSSLSDEGIPDQEKSIS